VDEACAASLSGWDFSFLTRRTRSQTLPWSYLDLATKAARAATRVLDIDTGGGEVFAAIRPPKGSIALEPHPPNVQVATATLKPLGVEVRPRKTSQLPVPDAAFDLVLNRHGALDFGEIGRVLQPAGLFLTEQVGTCNDIEFNEAFGLPTAKFGSALGSLTGAREALTRAGLTVSCAEEAWPRTQYLDIGAVVFQLRAVPWQVPGFDVVRHRPQLQAIHQRIMERGSFIVTSHRLLLAAARS
jgi:SAM-dependent methyltransferase